MDLHLHSTASDGAYEPAEVVRRAAAEGISVLALSDHDTTAGVAEALAAAAALPKGPRVIPAIELTVRVRPGDRGTVHLLGYGIDLACGELQDVARRNRRGKRTQIAATLQQLREREGIAFDLEELSAGREPDAYLGRHHIASALVRRGLSRSRTKAFRRYLRNERVPEVEVVGAEEGLRAIVAAGGVPVLAHPTDLDLGAHLNPLVEYGLRGIEAHRPRTTPAHLERILRRAERHGLAITGGSDFHGHYPEAPLGTWRAPHEALAPFVEELSRGG
ncbi:MAG: PHP domain-containing protein [Planctomycetota bacterium]